MCLASASTDLIKCFYTSTKLVSWVSVACFIVEQTLKCLATTELNHIIPECMSAVNGIRTVKLKTQLVVGHISLIYYLF